MFNIQLIEITKFIVQYRTKKEVRRSVDLLDSCDKRFL